MEFNSDLLINDISGNNSFQASKESQFLSDIGKYSTIGVRGFKSSVEALDFSKLGFSVRSYTLEPTFANPIRDNGSFKLSYLTPETINRNQLSTTIGRAKSSDVASVKFSNILQGPTTEKILNHLGIIGGAASIASSYLNYEDYVAQFGKDDIQVSDYRNRFYADALAAVASQSKNPYIKGAAEVYSFASIIVSDERWNFTPSQGRFQGREVNGFRAANERFVEARINAEPDFTLFL